MRDTKKRNCLPLSILEMISNILGDTNDGLTGSEIHKFLLESQIKDISEGEFLSKKKKTIQCFYKLPKRVSVFEPYPQIYPVDPFSIKVY